MIANHRGFAFWRATATICVAFSFVPIRESRSPGDHSSPGLRLFRERATKAVGDGYVRLLRPSLLQHLDGDRAVSHGTQQLGLPIKAGLHVCAHCGGQRDDLIARQLNEA